MPNHHQDDDEAFFDGIKDMTNAARLASDESLPPAMREAGNETANEIADRLRGS